jgi:DNA-binding MarR family transcriptional regulator
MWRVLAVLSNNGGQRQVDLSGLTSIDSSTLSRLVSRMIHAGLVTRIRSEKSSREVVVALSPKGRALSRKLIPIAKRLEQVASAGVSARDMAAAKRVLLAMHGNMAGRDGRRRVTKTKSGTKSGHAASTGRSRESRS